MEVNEALALLVDIGDPIAFKIKASFECYFRFDAGYSKAQISLEDKEDFLK